MLQMDQVTAIRHAVLVVGRSRRWAARTFKVARGTVDGYVDGTVTPGKRKTARRESPRRTAAEAELQRVIAETAVAKKQQLTAQRAHELLKERGVDVGYTVVKELMAARRRAAAETFVPLLYKPGELAEVDFFEVVVDLDGTRTEAFLFVMRLMSSSRDFCWVYPRQDRVCFLDGHVRAFAHFGGVPERAAYDNLKAAVRRHLVGGERELTAKMLAATRHYLFEACFCRPYEGHDKGGVEARGKNIRLQSLVPVPSGTTLDEVSAAVLADVERRFWAKPGAEERWRAEADALHDVGQRPFDPRQTEVSVPISSRSTVVVEGATYSVPTSWPRMPVTTHAGVSEVEIVASTGQSETRKRLRKGESDIDYAAHYLEELSTKPQALRQVADALLAQLGEPFPRWWEQLVEDLGARDAARKMARILRGIIELGRDECVRRVTHALHHGDAIATALLVPSAALEPPANLSLVPVALDVTVECSSVASFDALLQPALEGAA
jgi:transposase